MTRSDPPLHRHLLTRSDLARLAVPAATILDWLGNGALEPVGVLGDDESGDPVFTVIAPELRRELLPRLGELGKPAVVLTPLRVRSLLVRARMAMASPPVEPPVQRLEALPVTTPMECERAAAEADQLAVQDLATVLQEVAAEIEVDVEVMLKLAEEEVMLEAETARLADPASPAAAADGAPRFADAFPAEAAADAAPATDHEAGDDLDGEQDSDANAADNDICFDIDDLASAFAAEEQRSSPSSSEGTASTPVVTDPPANAIVEPSHQEVPVTAAAAAPAPAPTAAATVPTDVFPAQSDRQVADAALDSLFSEPSAPTPSAPTAAATAPMDVFPAESDRELADAALDRLVSEPPAPTPSAPTEAMVSDPPADASVETSHQEVPVTAAAAAPAPAPTAAATAPTDAFPAKSDRELADAALDCLVSEPPAPTPSAPAAEISTMQSDTEPTAAAMAWDEEPAAPPTIAAAATTPAAPAVTIGEFSGLPDALDAVLGEFAAKPVDRPIEPSPAEPAPAEAEFRSAADSAIADAPTASVAATAATAEPASSVADAADVLAGAIEPSERREPTPVIAVPTPAPDRQPLRSAVHDPLPADEIVARLDRTAAALTQTGDSMQRVESFLGDLKHALADLSHRPAPATLDVQPLVEAVQVGFERATAQSSATNAVLTTLSERLGGLGQQVEHGMQQAVAAMSARAEQPKELAHAASAAAPTPLLVAPAERTPIALLALAALVLGWSVLFWFKTGSPRLALGTLIAANLVGCCLLLSRRSR